jgi:hypothetical protein
MAGTAIGLDTACRTMARPPAARMAITWAGTFTPAFQTTEDRQRLLAGLQKPGEMPHILGMAKRKRVRVRKQSKVPWEVIQITKSPARFIGVVYAADEQAALATAIEQFESTKPHEQKKLMVRPQQ